MQMNDITMLNSSQFLQSFELLMTSSGWVIISVHIWTPIAHSFRNNVMYTRLAKMYEMQCTCTNTGTWISLVHVDL